MGAEGRRAPRGRTIGVRVQPREVISALRRRWYYMVAGLALGFLVALVVSSSQTPRYVSSTQFFVSTTESSTTSDVFQGGQFSQQRVASYAQLLSGEKLASRVIRRLDLDVTP